MQHDGMRADICSAENSAVFLVSLLIPHVLLDEK